MKVIAKTDNGVLIEASENEVKEILNAVNGKQPEEVEIGQKIPAIDYAGTIEKIKALSKNHLYISMLSYVKSFNIAVSKLSDSVESANEIN